MGQEKITEAISGQEDYPFKDEITQLTQREHTLWETLETKLNAIQELKAEVEKIREERNAVLEEWQAKMMEAWRALENTEK